MPAATITVQNLSKKYGQVEALRDISLTVNPGELFGLIGPDGAGKTTLMRIITTLLVPGSGSVTVKGLDVVKDYKELRKIFGYMPGRFSLHQDLTVEENLRFFAGIFKSSLKENYYLIKDIYILLEPFKDRKAGKLSGGMKQKLALCCALIHRPEILILDEPTTGVDAISRIEFWEMLKRLKESGITIMVSTPYMDEASRCDRVALIQKGQILSLDTPVNIISSFKPELWAIRSFNMHSLPNDLRKFPQGRTVFPFGLSVHMTTLPGTTLSGIVDFLASKGHAGIRAEIIKPNIEDCFMELMSN